MHITNHFKQYYIRYCRVNVHTIRTGKSEIILHFVMAIFIMVKRRVGYQIGRRRPEGEAHAKNDEQFQKETETFLLLDDV